MERDGVRRALLAGGPALTVAQRRFSPGRVAVLLGVAVLVFAADRITKQLVVAHLGLGQQVPSSGPVVIRRVENRGAAFGLFPNLQVLFLLVAAVVAVYIVVLGHRLRAGPFRQAVLGAILGGALANAGDRLRQGYVVDFIDIARIPGINFKYATFNVADMAIVVGILLAVFTFRGSGGARQAER